MDELVDIGKVGWLKDFYTTDDKKGLITKVRSLPLPLALHLVVFTYGEKEQGQGL